MTDLPNPHICGDGTVYYLYEGGGDAVYWYVVAGGTGDRWRWRVNEASGRRYFVNAATRASVWDLPEVPAAARPLDVASTALCRAAAAALVEQGAAGDPSATALRLAACHLFDPARALALLAEAFPPGAGGSPDLPVLEAKLRLFLARHGTGAPEAVPATAKKWQQTPGALLTHLSQQNRVDANALRKPWCATSWESVAEVAGILCEPVAKANGGLTLAPVTLHVPLVGDGAPAADPAKKPPRPAAAGGAADRLVAKLARFYAAAAPEKVAQCPLIAERFGGDELALFENLKARYPDHAALLSADQADGAAPVAAFPSSPPKVEQPLDANTPAPPPRSSSALAKMNLVQRLTAFYGHAAPDKIGQIERIVEHFDDEAALVDSLKTRYPSHAHLLDPPSFSVDKPRPPSPASSARPPRAATPASSSAGGHDAALTQKLSAFYAAASPDKLGQVPVVVQQFGGAEDELIKNLKSRYPSHAHLLDPAPKPPGNPGNPLPPILKSPRKAPAAALSQKLSRFYAVAAPDQLPQVPAIVAKFEADEAQLVAELKKKYPDHAHLLSPIQAGVCTPDEAEETSKSTFGRQLVGFYKAAAPEKVNQVPHILRRFKNEEEELLSSLRARYPDNAHLLPAPPPGKDGSLPLKTSTNTNDPPGKDGSDDPPGKDGSVPLKTSTKNNDPRADGSPPPLTAARLEKFYSAACPGKVGQVPAILRQFHGDEAALLDNLRARFPGFAHLLGGAADADRGQKNDLAAQLVAFYKAAAPDKVEQVPAILEQFKGDEAKLLENLRARYPSFAHLLGEAQSGNQPAESDLAAQLVTFYKAAAPDKVEQVPTILEQFKGDEAKLLENLRARYPSFAHLLGEAQSGNQPAESDLAAQLVTFYKAAAPDKVEQVPTILQQFKGDEAKLLENLRARYPSFAHLLGETQDENNKLGKRNLTAQLVAFYKAAAPDKVEQVPTILQQFKGDEAKLLENLRARYPSFAHLLGETQDENNKLGKRDLTAQLVAFYKAAAPDKVEQVPTILQRFKGEEAKLLENLRARFPESAHLLADPAIEAPADDSELSKRLLVFYRAASPEKVDQVPAIVAQYKGEEAKLLDTLRARFPDSAHLLAEPGVAKKDDVSLTDRLLAFYKVAAPEKVEQVPAIVAQYKGEEAKLLDALRARFPDSAHLLAEPGVDKNGGASFTERLLAFYKVAAPEKLEQVPVIVAQYKGEEAKLLDALRARFPDSAHLLAEPGVAKKDDVSLTDRLLAFYKVAAPEKVEQVPAIVAQYKGEEAKLLDTLRARFPDYAHLLAEAGVAKDGGVSLTDRLLVFYKVAAPEKLEQVPVIVAQYKGEEAKLLDALRARFPDSAHLLEEPSDARGDARLAPSQASEPEKKDQPVIAVQHDGEETIVQEPRLPTDKPPGHDEKDARSKADLAERLHAFYEAAAPEKLDQVPVIAARYKGDREELFDSLRSRFPRHAHLLDEPAPPPPPPPPAAGGEKRGKRASTLGARLAAFYAAAAPERVSQVSSVLERFAGTEDELLQTLRDRYPAHAHLLAVGRMPDEHTGATNSQLLAAGRTDASSAASDEDCEGQDPAAKALAQRLASFYREAAPDRVEHVPAIVGQFKGNTAELLATLRARYPRHAHLIDAPGGAAAAAPLESSLAAFYRAAAPEKLGQVPEIARRFRGEEAELLGNLRAKYPAFAHLLSDAGEACTAEKLAAFYRSAAPDQLDAVPGLAREYSGQPEKLLATLLRRHPQHRHLLLSSFGGAGGEAESSWSDATTAAMVPVDSELLCRELRGFYRAFAPERAAAELPAVLAAARASAADALRRVKRGYPMHAAALDELWRRCEAAAGEPSADDTDGESYDEVSDLETDSLRATSSEPPATYPPRRLSLLARALLEPGNGDAAAAGDPPKKRGEVSRGSTTTSPPPSAAGVCPGEAGGAKLSDEHVRRLLQTVRAAQDDAKRAEAELRRSRVREADLVRGVAAARTAAKAADKRWGARVAELEKSLSEASARNRLLLHDKVAGKPSNNGFEFHERVALERIADISRGGDTAQLPTQQRSLASTPLGLTPQACTPSDASFQLPFAAKPVCARPAASAAGTPPLSFATESLHFTQSAAERDLNLTRLHTEPMLQTARPHAVDDGTPATTPRAPPSVPRKRQPDASRGTCPHCQSEGTPRASRRPPSPPAGQSPNRVAVVVGRDAKAAAAGGLAAAAEGSTPRGAGSPFFADPGSSYVERPDAAGAELDSDGESTTPPPPMPVQLTLLPPPPPPPPVVRRAHAGVNTDAGFLGEIARLAMRVGESTLLRCEVERQLVDLALTVRKQEHEAARLRAELLHYTAPATAVAAAVVLCMQGAVAARGSVPRARGSLAPKHRAAHSLPVPAHDPANEAAPDETAPLHLIEELGRLHLLHNRAKGGNATPSNAAQRRAAAYKCLREVAADA
ncbi:hypothetical protein DIPPA_23979 [Diplonema papillatum]|nr:hypothetical protein DIPPA_23979 [Diplonema papillatum]